MENLEEQQGGDDIVDVIAYENHISQCEEYMKDAAKFLKG